MRGTSLLAVVVACAWGLSACQRAPMPLTPPRTKPAEPIKVYLPPTPDLNRPQPPAQHSDGAYTARGVSSQASTLLNKDVSVRAVVAEVRACNEEDERYCALPSHAVLVDDLSEPVHRLLAVGARLKQLGGLEPGSRIEVKGRVDTVSPDGRLVALDGLLVLPPPDEVAEEPEEEPPTRRRKRRRPARIDFTTP